MTAQIEKWLMRALLILAIGAGGWFAWQHYNEEQKEDTLVSGNGRIEATEINIAAKMAGRVKDILVKEGDFISAGQKVAVMESDVLAAQLRQAEAELQHAESSVVIAQSQLIQRRAEKAATQAVRAQRKAELAIAEKRLARSSLLAQEGASPQQEADDDQADVERAKAAVSAVHAQIAAADAAIATAQAQLDGARSTVAAAQAQIERIKADLTDTSLEAQRDGRVQYRVVQPGEVVAAGGRVLNMVDLSDVYMTFFLPTKAAGRVALGQDVRLVLDAAPQFVLPAKVSFVADVAQFTPKTVETAVEREKLMFRVRAQLPVDLLKKHILQVKTGLPGMAYVRLDPNKPWPAELALKLPQ